MCGFVSLVVQLFTLRFEIGGFGNLVIFYIVNDLAALVLCSDRFYFKNTLDLMHDLLYRVKVLSPCSLFNY